MKLNLQMIKFTKISKLKTTQMRKSYQNKPIILKNLQMQKSTFKLQAT